MKKLLGIMFLVLLILTACNSPKLSKVDALTDELQGKIDPNLRLQLINTEYNTENGSYIIFHTSGEVEADLDTQDNRVIINFTVQNSEDDTVQQHVYYLTTDTLHDTIDVKVDGQSIPFDNITN